MLLLSNGGTVPPDNVIHICIGAQIHRVYQKQLNLTKDAKGSALPNVGYAKEKLRVAPTLARKNKICGIR